MIIYLLHVLLPFCLSMSNSQLTLTFPKDRRETERGAKPRQVHGRLSRHRSRGIRRCSQLSKSQADTNKPAGVPDLKLSISLYLPFRILEISCCFAGLRP